MDEWVKDAIETYWNSTATSDFADPPGPGFDEGGGNAVTVSFVNNLPSGVLGQASCTVGAGGVIVSAEVELMDDSTNDLTEQEYKNVAAHELGHAIGLRHRGGPRTMMFNFLVSDPSAYPPLSRADTRWLDRLYDD